MISVIVLWTAPFITALPARALAGAGTSLSPYQVTSCADFADINDDLTAYYVLMNDIDCTSSGASITVGDNAHMFSGNFDGGNHKVTINISSGSYPHPMAGLFNYVSGATLANIKIAGSINTNVASGALGGYVEYAYATNVTSTAAVTGGSITGGLIAYTTSMDIVNASVAADVTGTDTVGGVTGRSDSTTLTSTTYSGNVSSVGDYAGGLSGQAFDVSYTKCSSQGTVMGVANIGGAVGYLNNSSSGDINEIYSTSDVTASGYFAGGLVGGLFGTGDINNSYARGDVTGAEVVGGIVGATDDNTLRAVYATGHLTGGVYRGGIIGVDYGTTAITDSFWDDLDGANPLTTSGSTLNGDVGYRTTAEMTFPDLYTTNPDLDTPWDFEEVWGMNNTNNNSYPFLQWQGFTIDFPRDHDGISSAIEDAAPNDGDANNDGTPDAEQDNVTSLLSPETGNYITLAINNSCAFTSATVARERDLTKADVGFDYPDGFVSFTADCGVNGFVLDVNVYFYGSKAASPTVRKYTSLTNSFTTVPGVTIQTQTIGGLTAQVASYQVIDGSALDDDGAQNGNITDPVGLGVAALAAPNTGLGGRR